MAEPQTGLQVDYVAERCNCYPGEPLTFYARVQGKPPLPGFTLHLVFPAELNLSGYRGPAALAPRVVGMEAHWRITWEVPPAAGAALEFQVETSVAPLSTDLVLVSHATAISGAHETAARVTATTAVTAWAHGRYLQYLPALYESDELMGRFLMLFESFWKPLEQQIEQLPYYFDPRTAPSDLLPWLASWLNLVLDEQWPEEKRRQLLLRALQLYRQRGTLRGLAEHLYLYTGVQPEIVEHCAKNFALGRESTLGMGMALGQRNAPHTFTVTLRLPALTGADAAEIRRQENARRRVVESIIEAEKPAHTTYTLHIISQGRAAADRDR